MSESILNQESQATTQSSEAAVISLSQVVPEEFKGKRIDQVAATFFSEFSREQLKQWINNGELTLDGIQVKAKTRLKGGETLALNAKIEAHSEDLPEDIPINIIYEDDDVMVVNKQAGLVVHPGAGNWTGTLVNGLLHHNLALKTLPRAGLVHRIDKDTSGLLVVGKTSQAQQELSLQLQDKTVYRHYLAVVVGEMVGELKAGGTIDAPIKRHPVDRVKMSVQEGGKEAVSHFNVEAFYNGYTLVNVELETGRTHQIRVHMAHIGHPLVGDATYGGRKQLSAHVSAEVREAIIGFKRQALHAYELGFVHPTTGEDMLFTADLPDDMQQLLTTLAN